MGFSWARSPLTSKMLRAVTRLGVVRHVAQQAQRNFGLTAVVSNPADAQEITDPIQSLFLDKLREYRSKAKGGKIVGVTPEVEARLKDEMDKVERMFNPKGLELARFPTFDFAEPYVEPPGLGDQAKDLELPEEGVEDKEAEEDNKP